MEGVDVMFAVKRTTISLVSFLYKNITLRFSKQIRNPYLISIADILHDKDTGEPIVYYNFINKRGAGHMSIKEFMNSEMYHLVNPKVIFQLGIEYGKYSERIPSLSKGESTKKNKVAHALKRVFIDE